MQKGQTSLVITCSVYVSPPPAITIPTTSAFKDEQKASVGPRHGPKYSGKKRQSTTKLTKLSKVHEFTTLKLLILSLFT